MSWILAGIIGIALGFGIAWFFRVVSWSDRERALRAEFSQWHSAQIKGERADALTSSRRVLVGKYVERFVPFHVKYTPADMHFMGSPVDYVVFNGLHEDNCTEVVFLEVKTNEATLSRREKSVRNAIRNGNVRWEEVQLNVAQES